MKVYDVMQSGEFDGETDDRLKDEDNVTFVMRMPDAVRDDWLTTLQFGRVPDRLIENTIFGDESQRESGARELAEFRAGWAALRSGTPIEPESPFADLFTRLAERWQREQLTEGALRRWDRHLEALWYYRRPADVIRTVDDYRDALYELSGTFFQTCPYQPVGLADAVGALGALDQFFNNLRDLREDIARGITYLPPDLLHAFGIASDELPSLVDRYDSRFERLHAHLLATLVADFRRQAAPLFSATGLHESWVDMLHHVSVRHSRIEYMARTCRFNTAPFAIRYWALVVADLSRR